MSTKNGSGRKLLPLELALLEILPDEGQMLGFTPIALNVKSILRRKEFSHEKGSVVSGRLRSLLFEGFTTTQTILPVQSGLGWQRTAKGKRVLEEQRVVST